MIHARLQPLLETMPSIDHIGFLRVTGINHALAVLEKVPPKRS